MSDTDNNTSDDHRDLPRPYAHKSTEKLHELELALSAEGIEVKEDQNPKRRLTTPPLSSLGARKKGRTEISSGVEEQVPFSDLVPQDEVNDMRIMAQNIGVVSSNHDSAQHNSQVNGGIFDAQNMLETARSDSNDTDGEEANRPFIKEGPRDRGWSTVSLPYDTSVCTMETSTGRRLMVCWKDSVQLIRLDDHFTRTGKPPAFPVKFNIHTELSLKKGFLRRRYNDPITLYKMRNKRGGHKHSIWVSAGVFLTIACVYQCTYEMFGTLEFCCADLQRSRLHLKS